MSDRIGYVVATHPEDVSVDLVMADDGSRLVGVQLLSHDGSTRSGSVDLPAVPEKQDKWDISQLTGQDMKAVVGFASGHPYIVGFLYPQINQMTLNDPKTKLHRHQSDVLTVIDGNGNIDLRHPSGFAIRIGETPDHLNPAGMNADKNLTIDRNTDRAAYFRLSTADGTAILTITPDGVVTINNASTLNIHSGGAITMESDDSITFVAPRIDLNP